jgi:hypothetical protein
MKFRDPWIDPRITQVRPDAAEAYLRARGWKPFGPAANPALLLFEGPGPGEGPTTLLLPRQVEDGPSVQRMIDLVAELARAEGRYAGDVLTDILRQPTAAVLPNGPAVPAQAEPAPR